jgi:hypothetical protein
MFGDGTLALGLASVAQLLPNRSLEETLAAFTAHSSIMPAWNITDTVYRIPLKGQKLKNLYRRRQQRLNFFTAVADSALNCLAMSATKRRFSKPKLSKF